MNWSLEFYPLLPGVLLYVAVGLSCLVSLIFVLTHKTRSVLRITAFVLLVFALFNPHIKTENRESLKNIAVVISDESSSQKIANRPQITQSIKQQLKNRLEKIQNLEVRWITGQNNKDNKKEETAVFRDLKKGLATIPSDRLAGVFIITDGQIHDIPKKPEELQPAAPVHTLITGQKTEIDRRIDIMEAPRFGIVGSSASIKLRVMEYGTGKTPKGLATLNIMREDEPPEEVRIEVGETLEIPMSFPHAGANYIEIELQAIPDELTLANNRLAIVAQGVRENLRVLLVSGEPHAGERTWRNLLKSDASVDLVHFTILRPPEKQDGTPINELSLIAFPTRELFSEKLDQFDLIIFDRYRRRGVLPLLYLENISRYVEKGGAILVATGPTYASPMSLYQTPLAQILPAAPTGNVIEQAYRAQITKAGQRHPVTRGLPGSASLKSANATPSWGSWFRLVQATSHAGNVLMEGVDKNPLLVLNRLGEGRVAILLSDHAWLWARGYEGGGPHTALLRNLAHWLMQEPDLEEEYLTATTKGSRIIIERRSMENKIDDISVRYPNGAEKQLELEQVSPGIWQRQIDVEETGLYRFSSDSLTALAHSGPLNSREMTKVTASDEAIQPVLKHTGGGVFWFAQHDPTKLKTPRIIMTNKKAKMYSKDWIALHDRKAYEVKGAKLIPLLNSILALALLLGLLATTWYREGR